MNNGASEMSRMYASIPSFKNKLFRYYLIQGIIKNSPLTETDSITDNMEYEKKQIEITALSE